MIGVDGLIEVCFVTTETRIRCVVIISIMASGTIRSDDCMCSIKHIEVIMYIKRGWYPFTLGMASCAVIVKLQFYVLRICGGIVVCLVTSEACVRSIVVIAIVASRTICCDLSVRTIEDIIVIVHIEGRRVPLRISRVASRAIGG